MPEPTITNRRITVCIDCANVLDTEGATHAGGDCPHCGGTLEGYRRLEG